MSPLFLTLVSFKEFACFPYSVELTQCSQAGSDTV